MNGDWIVVGDCYINALGREEECLYKVLFAQTKEEAEMCLEDIKKNDPESHMDAERFKQFSNLRVKFAEEKDCWWNNTRLD